jgi:cold shock CspA family protein
MAQGIIHSVQIARGIGLIRPDDGTADLSFARSALAAGAFEELREGQWVTYEPAPDSAAPESGQAIQIRLVLE